MLETTVVEKNLQNSLCRRMVLCRCGRVNSQATSPPGFGWVTTAVPLVGCGALPGGLDPGQGGLPNGPSHIQ